MIYDNYKYNDTIKRNSELLMRLQKHFPEFIENNNEEIQFNYEKFKNDLKSHNIDEFKHGLELNFIGKSYAKKQSGQKPSSVIVPNVIHNKKSVNKDSENLYFTGDNLEVLRHLQQNYKDSVDFIYIDPPYNTGSDGFLYPDTFEYDDSKLMSMFSFSEEEMKKFKNIQGKSSHSAWLTFMYPRLYLAKNLLKEDGVIYVSIDENEHANLKLILDDIFGEQGFIENYIWESNFRPDNSSQIYRKNAENILLYVKNKQTLNKLYGTTKKSNGLPSLTKNSMKISTVKFKAGVVETFLKNGIYKAGETKSGYILENDIIVEDGIIKSDFSLTGRLIWGQTYLDEQIKNGTKIIIKNESFVPYSEKKETTSAPNKIIPKDYVSDVLSGRSELMQIFNNQQVFNYPKPTSLIEYLLKTIDKKDAVVLDFFSGSATTADAVLKLNNKDEGSRKLILVQLPEEIYIEKKGKKIAKKGSETAFEYGFKTIDEIGRKRIEKVDESLDNCGFKHYFVKNLSFRNIEELYDISNLELDLFDDMEYKFSADNLDVIGGANSKDTILTTWLVQDGFKFNFNLKTLNINDYEVNYIEASRIYLIEKGWSTENTRELINLIGTGRINVQTIVIFAYYFNFELVRELEIALSQLDNKVNLLKRY